MLILIPHTNPCISVGFEMCRVGLGVENLQCYGVSVGEAVTPTPVWGWLLMLVLKCIMWVLECNRFECVGVNNY